VVNGDFARKLMIACACAGLRPIASSTGAGAVLTLIVVGCGSALTKGAICVYTGCVKPRTKRRLLALTKGAAPVRYGGCRPR